MTPQSQLSTHLRCEGFRSSAGARISARALLALLLMLAPVAARAGSQAKPARADAPVVVMSEARQGCFVQGSFHAAVADTLAWSVLTDYDHISRFVSSVRSSRVERRDAAGILLRQDTVGGFFLFHRRVQVLLEIHEQHGSRIRFHDVLGKDFHAYVGEWNLTADSTGTRVDYQLKAEPKSPMPRSLCRGMLKRVAQDLLEQVRTEMLRRAQAGS